MEELLRKGTIAALVHALTSRRMSARELVGWYLNRIEALNQSGPAINAVREIAPDALENARRADEALASGRKLGTLHGIPVLLKDNVLTADGMAAAAGCAALKAFVPRREATLVKRLRSAGAIILGKTNLTEFADYVSDVMPSGFSGAGGIVKNPQGLEPYGRGLGSSVGSAASVAARLAPIAIGSETQNSIQTPASVTSLYGFKPSVGAVSRSGLVPLVPSQDSPGVLCRSAEDAARVLAVIAGGDAHDTATLDLAHGLSEALHAREPGTIRIGVPRRAMADRADFAGLMSSFEVVLSRLSRGGVTIVDPADLPSAEQLQDVRSSVFRTEFKAAINGFLDDHHSPCGIHSLRALIDWNDAHPDAIPYGQSLLLAAEATTGLDDPQYRRDRRRDIALSRSAGIDAALAAADLDALIAPMGAAAKCTGKAGAPSFAIPAGLDASGAPFGVTLITSRGGDRRLLDIGTTIAGIIGDSHAPAI
jgi:amidase